MKRRNEKVEWGEAGDIGNRVQHLVRGLEMEHVKRARVFCFRSKNSKTRAYARVWGLSRIWQQALTLEPAYVLEVISERFDRLPAREQDKVLIHELLHIPKTFSGALLPHRRRGGVSEDRVGQLYLQVKSK